jgi:hypothetical protein
MLVAVTAVPIPSCSALRRVIRRWGIAPVVSGVWAGTTGGAAFTTGFILVAATVSAIVETPQCAQKVLPGTIGFPQFSQEAVIAVLSGTGVDTAGVIVSPMLCCGGFGAVVFGAGVETGCCGFCSTKDDQGVTVFWLPPAQQECNRSSGW